MQCADVSRGVGEFLQRHQSHYVKESVFKDTVDVSQLVHKPRAADETENILLIPSLLLLWREMIV